MHKNTNSLSRNQYTTRALSLPLGSYTIAFIAKLALVLVATPQEFESRISDFWRWREKMVATNLNSNSKVPGPANSNNGVAIPSYVTAVSGSLGGLVEACSLQPIDVIKTRLQLDARREYRGIFHCGSTIVNREGVHALWKGLTPFATHLTLKYTLRMGSNALFQSALSDAHTGNLSAPGRFFAGFGAGVTEAVVIVTPFEVVKIRLQQQRNEGIKLKYKGPVHCATTIIREEGLLRGLWAGVAPTVVRNGTNQAVMFSAKDYCDKLLWKKIDGDGVTLLPWQSMVSGFIAGFAGPLATGPFDVVKTRLMAQTRDGELRYKGMVHAITRIYADEGLFALWKGLLPRLMRIPPGQAIMWAVADQVTGLYVRRTSSSDLNLKSQPRSVYL